MARAEAGICRAMPSTGRAGDGGSGGEVTARVMADTFADRVLAFHRDLALPKVRARGVKTLDPYRNPVTSELAARFYRKYYSDSKLRVFIFGINPGRFGAGMTGVPFTDPIRLQQTCGIENDLPKKQELSSVFIYKIIE